MKVGAIDIGTNSMRLLIADYRDGNFINRKNLLIQLELVMVWIVKDI